MKKVGNTKLPPEFFELIPVVGKRLTDNGGEAPRWRWVWFLYGVAVVFAVMWGFASLCPDSPVRRLSWLLIVATWVFALSALTLQQWAVIRKWFVTWRRRK